MPWCGQRKGRAAGAFNGQAGVVTPRRAGDNQRVQEVVVYHASPGRSAEEAVETLLARGLSPRMLDDPRPEWSVLHVTSRRRRVRIAVPAEEVKQAVEILRAWDVGRDAVVERAAAQLYWQAAVGLFISGTVVLSCVGLTGGLSRGISLEAAATLVIAIGVGAVVGTIAVAQLTERLTKRRASDAPQCRACGYILLGLDEPRCPECGHPFNPALLRLGADPAADDDAEDREDSG